MTSKLYDGDLRNIAKISPKMFVFHYFNPFPTHLPIWFIMYTVPNIIFCAHDSDTQSTFTRKTRTIYSTRLVSLIYINFDMADCYLLAPVNKFKMVRTPFVPWSGLGWGLRLPFSLEISQESFILHFVSNTHKF